MKFGSVPDKLLPTIDLRLPPEAPGNAVVLPGRRGAPKVSIGAATWGAPAWAGKIYPPKTPATKYRHWYPRCFNAIELNATHYTIYPPPVIRQWATATAGQEFLFCPKFPQAISHYSHFENTEVQTAAFLESIQAFESGLGPAFLQLSESFAPQQKEALFTYLATLPDTVSCFLEVRHPLWFADAAQAAALLQTLQQLHIGLVLTDTPGRRDLVHMALTVPRLFLRFVCNGLHPSSFSRTDAWIMQLQNWLERGLQEVYVFLHPGQDAAVPELAAYWIAALNKQCGLQLRAPALVQQQLF